jgi:hypothetical protein
LPKILLDALERRDEFACRGRESQVALFVSEGNSNASGVQHLGHHVAELVKDI